MLGARLDRLAARGIDRLLERHDVPVGVELWDGRRLGARAERAVGTVRVGDRVALLRLAFDPDLAFGDLWVERRLEIDGDRVAVLRALFGVPSQEGRPHHFVIRWRTKAVPRQDHLAAARRNARHHYDVGNDFYALWLDELMLYSCAYFPNPQVDLEEAQIAKMDHVCRKLALRPGDRVIEAGCGWGALALHMARYCGAQVRAFNVSSEQLLYARAQAEKQGLRDRVEFIEDDYRNISGRCDAFVSVGMLEHVGRDHYAELGKVIDRCLAPFGRGLLHTIGRSREQQLNRWLRTRVFPHAHPPTLREMMEVFEPHGLAVLDTENLRLHYALTGRHWLERFEANLGLITDLVGERIARTWHLYLVGVPASFEAGTLCLYQVVFTREQNNAIPWTRAHVYTGEPAAFGPPTGSDGAL